MYMHSLVGVQLVVQGGVDGKHELLHGVCHSIDNVTMCTVPMNSEREGGAILKGQEVAGMQDVPIDMQEVPRQTVSGSS